MTSYNSTLQSNNTDLQEVLQILQGKATGGEQATPEITIDSTNGLVTAIAGTKSSTYQLAFQPAKTITPSTASQVAVSSGYYTGGNITVAAVPTQSKSVTPTSSTQNVTPDSGKFLSKVTVNAIPSTYIQPSFTKVATTYTPTTTNQTISAGTYLTGVQTIKGDSNLVAGNIKSGVSIFGVSGTAQVGGETVVDDVSRAIIDGTITSVTDDNIENIGDYAFYNYSRLTTANFPACTTIGRDAFAYCGSLTTINFPACTTIESYAFRYCYSLTTANFPVCTTIDYDAFYMCKNLATVSFPVCTTIGGAAFNNCSRLTTVSFPVCTIIGSYAFDNCSRLATVSFPVCTTISSFAFNKCSSLITVSFPVCTAISSYAFNRCSCLTTANFPVCTTIGSSAFDFCTTLSSLQLGASSVCALANSNAFSSTPFAGYSSYFSGRPHIYVPASLISAYQSATNWTYFSSYFSAIESLEV